MYRYDHASYLSVISSLIMMALLSNIMSESDTSPILRLDTCSESEVHFTCTVNGTEMQWKIDFSRHTDILARYFSDDMIGDRRNIFTNRATSYTFNLTSTTPLTSTMIANVSRDLDGATVICQDGFTDAALEEKMSLHEPPQPHNLTVVMSTDPGDPYVNVVLQWFDQNLDAALNQTYTITITRYPPSIADSGATFQTTNTSIQLALLYDQDYNISVVARNCIGSSIPAIIRMIHFNNCTLIVKDGVIAMNYNCLLSATTTTDEAMVSNCITDSTLDMHMATQKHGTVDPLVPSMIASHLFLSAFSCTVGILIGFLVYRCYISKKTQRTTTGPPESDNTEIVLSANEAYGRVNP